MKPNGDRLISGRKAKGAGRKVKSERYAGEGVNRRKRLVKGRGLRIQDNA